MALSTQGYRYAPAAVVAPFDYSVLVWGVILGWGLWQEVPAPNVWVGAAILTASGLYILHRETRKPTPVQPVPRPIDRKSVVSGKSVSVRVYLGARRIINKKNISTTLPPLTTHKPLDPYIFLHLLYSYSTYLIAIRSCTL